MGLIGRPHGWPKEIASPALQRSENPLHFALRRRHGEKKGEGRSASSSHPLRTCTAHSQQSSRKAKINRTRSVLPQRVEFTSEDTKEIACCCTRRK